MVTDSISFVEDHLEKILQQASDLTDESKKEQVYGKYLRFWSMMVITSSISQSFLTISFFLSVTVCLNSDLNTN
jgi:hypothetical protein